MLRRPSRLLAVCLEPSLHVGDFPFLGFDHGSASLSNFRILAVLQLDLRLVDRVLMMRDHVGIAAVLGHPSDCSCPSSCLRRRQTQSSWTDVAGLPRTLPDQFFVDTINVNPAHVP
ncbi:hypothetical protein BN77_1700 [Rhizobium mesoamericanum STM3625]|uniref:Uncharacterized protein n=1 Tax=Rhizobium mesoamericanum STM3625 TaxID=1211777 RepID=K0PXI6_9HYPH|nr:hypothetical protein BN77_1700 [Rhizobium mesoamericanum STM3625]